MAGAESPASRTVHSHGPWQEAPMSRGPLKTQGLEILHDLEAGFPRGADVKEPERSCKVLMIKPLSHPHSLPS